MPLSTGIRPDLGFNHGKRTDVGMHSVAGSSLLRSSDTVRRSCEAQRSTLDEYDLPSEPLLYPGSQGDLGRESSRLALADPAVRPHVNEIWMAPIPLVSGPLLEERHDDFSEISLLRRQLRWQACQELGRTSAVQRRWPRRCKAPKRCNCWVLRAGLTDTATAWRIILQNGRCTRLHSRLRHILQGLRWSFESARRHIGRRICPF